MERPFHVGRFSLVVVGRVLETLGSRELSVNEFGPVCFGTESLSHAMPPRITRNIDRPRASNSTMVDTQIPGPLAKFGDSIGVVTTGPSNPRKWQTPPTHTPHPIRAHSNH